VTFRPRSLPRESKSHKKPEKGGAMKRPQGRGRIVTKKFDVSKRAKKTNRLFVGKREYFWRERESENLQRKDIVGCTPSTALTQRAAAGPGGGG